MGVWQERRLLYKIGFSGVTVGALMFIVGFCAPSWAQFKMPWSSAQTQSMGLWQYCTVDMGLCVLSVDTNDPGWLKAVRALMCIALFFAVASCIVGLYCNCILKAQFSSDFFNKNMETSAVVSVVFGTFGLIIFATQASNYYNNQNGHVYWGFVLVCLAIASIGISAFFMFASHRLHLRALRNHFAHQQLNDSFHAQMHLPGYSPEFGSQMFITTPEGHFDFGPPPYETVVNCTPQNEVAPPPYSQVVKSEGEK